LVRVVFVCLGNICRSPTAEGVFRHLVEQQGLADQIEVDSSGTSAWHVGEAPDSRAQSTARGRGIDLSRLRARQAISADFEAFDYVLAMDSANYDDLRDICPPGREDRLHLFLSFAPLQGLTDVPDPYYNDGFDRVFDMLEVASRGLLADICERHGL
jgi:protein-tyrosine phosphatase